MQPFLSIGHRGASGYEPENTLRSIRRALELGANGIEIDVQLSSDGELVIFHDSKLRRTTGMAGTVSGTGFARLRQLDAGLGEQIPTLREVFDLIAGRAWLNIELKGQGTALPVVREVVRAVNATDGAWEFDQIVISSFDRRELAAVADLRRHSEGHPALRVGVLVARRPINLARLIARFGASSLHLPARLATPKRIARVRSAGLRVFVFTVNDPAEIARLRDWGADGVFTDFPDRATAILNQS